MFSENMKDYRKKPLNRQIEKVAIFAQIIFCFIAACFCSQKLINNFYEPSSRNENVKCFLINKLIRRRLQPAASHSKAY
jgi:hypothetical protein